MERIMVKDGVNLIKSKDNRKLIIVKTKNITNN